GRIGAAGGLPGAAVHHHAEWHVGGCKLAGERTRGRNYFNAVYENRGLDSGHAADRGFRDAPQGTFDLCRTRPARRPRLARPHDSRTARRHCESGGAASGARGRAATAAASADSATATASGFATGGNPAGPAANGSTAATRFYAAAVSAARGVRSAVACATPRCSYGAASSTTTG